MWSLTFLLYIWKVAITNTIIKKTSRTITPSFAPSTFSLNWIPLTLFPPSFASYSSSSFSSPAEQKQVLVWKWLNYFIHSTETFPSTTSFKKQRPDLRGFIPTSRSCWKPWSRNRLTWRKKRRRGRTDIQLDGADYTFFIFTKTPVDHPTLICSRIISPGVFQNQRHVSLLHESVLQVHPVPERRLLVGFINLLVSIEKDEFIPQIVSAPLHSNGRVVEGMLAWQNDRLSGFSWHVFMDCRRGDSKQHRGQRSRWSCDPPPLLQREDRNTRSHQWPRFHGKSITGLKCLD